MSITPVVPALITRLEPKVKFVEAPSERSLVEPTCAPLKNTFALSRPPLFTDVSAWMFKLSIFTFSPDARRSKVANLTLVEPTAMLLEGDAVFLAAVIEPPLMVADVALRAENVELAAVAKTGWLRSAS